MNSTVAIRLAIIIIVCYSVVTIVDFIEKDRYEEITDSQIRDIVAAEEITVLAEKRLNDRENPAALIFLKRESKSVPIVFSTETEISSMRRR